MTKNSTTLLIIVFLFTSFTGLCNTNPLVNTDSLILEYCKVHKLIPVKSSSGLYYVIKKTGNGSPVTDGQSVSVNYTESFINGKIFDSTTKKKFGHKEPFKYTAGAGQVIKGFEEGIKLLNVGGSAIIIIPPSLAYGDKDMGTIPGNSVLIFELHLLKVN